MRCGSQNEKTLPLTPAHEGVWTDGAEPDTIPRPGIEHSMWKLVESIGSVSRCVISFAKRLSSS